MHNLLRRSHLKSFAILGMLLALTRTSPAQAIVAGQRGAEIAPFVQTTLVNPDWGPTNNLGYTIGVDYTRFIRSIVQPSLEFRYNNANGTTTSEHSYMAGLKLETTVHGIHPYFTVLAGDGIINFANPVENYIGPTNSFLIYSLGGGAEFNVRSQWKVRLDFTEQTWNIDPQVLTPTSLGIGIAYRLPVHNGRVQ